MSDPSFFFSQRTIPTFDIDRVEEVQDEIFVALKDVLDTVSNDGTCYGQAVEESISVGEGNFVLRVRPGLRGLLLSQLRPSYPAHRVFRIKSHAEQRYLFSGDFLVRFAPEASDDQKREALAPLFENLEDDCPVPNGIYEVPEALQDNPVATHSAIAQRPFVLQVVPVFVAVPAPKDKLLHVHS